jgi:hypothetical protein
MTAIPLRRADPPIFLRLFSPSCIPYKKTANPHNKEKKSKMVNCTIHPENKYFGLLP